MPTSSHHPPTPLPQPQLTTSFWFTWWPSYWIWYAGMEFLHSWRKCSQNKVTFLHLQPSEGAGKASAQGRQLWAGVLLKFSHHCVLQSVSLFFSWVWSLLASGCCKNLWGEPRGTRLPAVAFALWTIPSVRAQGFYSPVFRACVAEKIFSEHPAWLAV